MTRKSLADLSLRKGRATLVILSILIGVFGLTAVNAATENIGSAFAYTRDQSAVPDLTFSIGAHRPDLVQRIAALPNVAIVQTRWEYLTHWLVSGGTGQVEMQIWSYDDFNAIKLQPFQLTSGHLPGPGEIVLETFDKALQTVSIGDTITVAGVGKQMVTFRVVGFGRTQGIAPLKEQRPGLSLGYTSASYLQQTVSGAMVT
ncbi:MAG TPA: ABC transporter permease, partial [Ktedonobacteraceae bacterium]|nr:ABC transporter permease [Ktedonobacteraceae bacterium]